MVKCNSINVPNVSNSNYQQQFRERELMSKRLSKYIASFDCFDKSLFSLPETNGSIFIASFATVSGAPIGIASPTFSLAFSTSTGIIKKLLKTTPSKRKKENE